MTNERERQDNENYSKNFTRVPNIVFVSYKHLTKEEKFLYCTLRNIYWDMKPRFVSLKELSEQSGYSISALSKMLPRLHICGLIHAEIRQEKGKDGKSKGHPKYHITIPDIWELNRQYFACPPEQRIDPSDQIVHQKNDIVHETTRNSSPNSTISFTKQHDSVLFGEQSQARVERAKDSNKDITKDTLKESKNGTGQQKPNVFTRQEASRPSIHPLLSSQNFSSSQEAKPKEEVELTEEEQHVYDLACQRFFVSEPPEITHTVKGHCAKMVKAGIKTIEHMKDLERITRQEQRLGNKPIYLGNLARGLNGWLQTQNTPSFIPIERKAGHVYSSYDDPDYADDSFYPAKRKGAN
jgi:hypothetical protein